MNGLTRKLMTLALASTLAAPVALLAADLTPDAHDSHHLANEQPAVVTTPPASNSPAQLQERMQTRMRAMQQITDPQARMSMMMVQMQDMNEMMKNMPKPKS